MEDRKEYFTHDGHGQLQEEQYGHCDKKEFLLGLMIEENHAAECSERAIEEGKHEQYKLWYAPLVVCSLMLVVAEEAECDDIGEEHKSQI